jgi:L-alanine-DL-glutamate epimerase-like enolase superfamily enzyme
MSDPAHLDPAGIEVKAFEFPTPSGPESDGTLTWDKTTAVTVEITAAGQTGLGWAYSHQAIASLITHTLLPAIDGRSAFDVPGCWEAMVRACRNLGRPGLVSQAIAAVDIALWDLKARILDVPLHHLFGAVRDEVPVYGSGGFVSLSDEELRAQIDGWLEAGCTAMKIKVGQDWGANPGRDMHRVALLNTHTPDGTTLMVDANGGYSPGRAKRLGAVYDSLGVMWFEEPVSSDDLAGLAMLRNTLRADIAAGEYADSVTYVQRMCAAGAVDCLQVDVTRCAGYTEWLRCAAIAAGHGLQISGHCAPSLHAAVAAAIPNLRHVEWFSDHARLEPILVDGAPRVRDGCLHLTDASGHGMHLRSQANDRRVA